jgi:2-polyprenylphenol 6-hydroxylase
MDYRKDHDVAVVGRGAIGAAVALGLAQNGLRVAWVGPQTPSGGSVGNPIDRGWDSRVYALSPGSRALLRRLRVWDALPVERVAPVYDMRVYSGPEVDAHEMHFDAYQGRVDALAWVLENRPLMRTLADAAGFAGVASVDGTVDSLQVDPPGPAGRARLRLGDGRELSVKLVIAADGADSRMRELAGIGASRRDYPQQAVVANFDATRSHGDCAYQWFGAPGVLALLPLPSDAPDRGRCSMVWSAPHALADELAGMTPEALALKVSDASHRVLGELSTITSARTFPLRLLKVDRLIAPRLVLAGDAAHVIHPLAGQGMNLGFADVMRILDVVKGREPYRDLSDELLWRRYERSRREAIASMQDATDGLQWAFCVLPRPLVGLRNLGWRMVAGSGWVKRRLIGQAAR